MGYRTPRYGALVTADEFYDEYSHRDQHYELVRGRLLFLGEPPGGTHGSIAGNIAYLLKQYLDAHPSLGKVMLETGFILSRSPDTVRAPDVSFVRYDHMPPEAITERYIPGAPDLAVEILSPSDRWSQVEDKILDYRSAGTRLIWIVEPARRRIVVRTSEGPVRTVEVGDQLDGGEVMPGLQVQVEKVFE